MDIEDLFSKLQHYGQWAGGLGGGTIVAYKLSMLWRSDRRKDRVDDAAEAYRDDLREQIETLQTRMQTLSDRCDRFAHERNEAVKESGRLGAMVEGLRDQLAEIKAERALAREEQRVLVMENAALRGRVAALTEIVKGLGATRDLPPLPAPGEVVTRESTTIVKDVLHNEGTP